MIRFKFASHATACVTRMTFLCALLALALHVVPGAVGPAHSQGTRKDDIVFNSRGIPLAGATVRVCAMPASGQPCTPLALIYSDAALTQALANPTSTDGLGNYFFYAAPGKYEIEISGPAITTKQIPNVILPNDPSAPSFTGAVSAFSLTLSGNLTVNGSTTVIGNLASGTLNLSNQSTPPGSASTGTVNLYTKTADKRLYYKDDTGTELGPLGAGAQTSTVNTFTANQNMDAGLHIKGPDPYSDMARYGGYANASPPATTATCANASTSVTLASALDFQDASKFPGANIGNGIVLYQCSAATGLTAPGAPTVTPFGVTGGSTTYSYRYVAEDLNGGLTAAGTAGSTTTGASALGTTSVSLSAATWNSTLNGEQVYTCSANPCPVSVNAPIRIDGFTNAHFNGNYTVIAQSTNTFTVYSPVTPAVTSETVSATAKVLACNILTLPLNTVPLVETGGDQVLRWIVYRNGTLAFFVQDRDPYYEDCGVTTPGANFPTYVPTTPGSAVNKYLATTIVSGGGTTSIVVANAAGNTISGVTALHDNSQNLLAALNASKNSTPVYANLSNAPFNAATVFTFSNSSNTELDLPTGASLNQPWVIIGSGYTFKGGQPVGGNSFQQEGVVNVGGNAFPAVIISQSNVALHNIAFKNIAFSAPQLGEIGFVAHAGGGSMFGLQMQNVGFGSTTSSSNVNIPAAVFVGLAESAIGKPGDRNACSVAQVAPGPPCMRFTTYSPAMQNGGAQANGILRDVQVNGFAMQGGGASVQVDNLPWINSGGSPSFGVSNLRFVDGLREVGKGPFLRDAIGGTYGNFYFKYLDDDAPNAAPANGWVDAAYSGNQAHAFGFEQVTTSVNGQVLVSGPGNIIVGPNVAFASGTTSTGFSSEPGLTGNGSISASGSASVGYLMVQPAAPNVVVGAHSSCASNCVAAGTYVYAITALDIYGNSSLLSPGTAATTDGTQTITVSWTPVAGQAITNPFRGSTLANALGLFNNGPGGSGFGGTSYVDTGSNFYTNSGFNQGIGASASLGSQGLAGQQLTITSGGFKDVISSTLTTNRTKTLPDVTGYIPVTSYVNSSYENATRANGSIGSNWTIQQNGLNIASNQIQGTTASQSNSGFWNANTFSAIQFAQVTITALNGATDFPGVTVLASGTGGSATYYDCVENSTTIFLQRVVNAGTTNLTSTASTGAVGDILRLEVAPGGALTCFKNGASTLTATDTQIASGSPGLLISGNVATEKNWSGGNLHPLAQLDTEQDWTKAQHFTQGIALGGSSVESFNNNPRAEQNIFLPGALTSTWTGATWTNDKAVTVTRIQVQAKTAPAGCTTNAIVRFTDSTTPINLTISAAANDSGALSQNYAAGSSLQVLVQTAAAGCTTSPADANVTVQYRMQ